MTESAIKLYAILIFELNFVIKVDLEVLEALEESLFPPMEARTAYSVRKFDIISWTKIRFFV